MPEKAHGYCATAFKSIKRKAAQYAKVRSEKIAVSAAFLRGLGVFSLNIYGAWLFAIAAAHTNQTHT
jgi:hypothetical protein